MADFVRIRLTQGLEAIIDAADEPLVSVRKWFAAKGRHSMYAHHSAWNGERPYTIRMHRLILNAPAGAFVDHRNGDGLDNRRANIRLCTAAENCRNARPHRTASSKFRGVSISATGNRWHAIITANSVQRFIGSFRSEIEAARAYDAAAIALHGEFARPNFQNDHAGD